MLIIFDIGGSKTRIARSDDGKSFSDPIYIDTPTNGNDGIKKLIEEIARISEGRPISAIAGGIAGVLNDDHSELVQAPNLPGWQFRPLKTPLMKSFRCPVYFENDTNIVGLGEAIAGAGRHYPIVVYITISTGVGGSRIVNETIDLARVGFEPGHQIINHETGETLEQLISGKANEFRYKTKITEIPKEAWRKIAKQTAVGIYNTILHWSPDVVVLGGSMITKPIGIPMKDILYELKHLPQIFPTLPTIKKATLGDFGGLYGGLAYLKNKIN